MLVDKVSDGMHQMRLSKADAAIEKQRVIRHTRCFRHRQGCRMGKPVGGAHHKCIKCRARIEHELGFMLLGFLFLFLLPGHPFLHGHEANLNPPSCGL